MKSKIQIGTLDTHTGGEPTRIILSGLENLSLGKGNVKEKRDFFRENYDWIRELLMKEPRGHADMFGAIIVSPEHEEADIGAFYMENKGYLDMCGHATMGIVTALTETGKIKSKSPLILETPAGLVKAWPKTKNGKVEKVTIQNVDSFIYGDARVNLETEKDEIEVPVDIVYSGNTIGLVDINSLNIKLEQDNLDKIIRYGLEIREKLNNKLDLRHKITKEQVRIDFTEFYEPRNEKPDKNVVILADGSVDRSPCGTGTCAKMTSLYEKGQLDLNEKYEHESIIGTIFEGKIIDVKEKEGIKLIKNVVTGRAYITGNHTFYLDPNDPIVGFNITR